jgi:hypothetical protein
MKKNICVIASISMSLFLAGCWLKSVHPFYSEKDLRFEEALIGEWIETSDENKNSKDEEDSWHFVRRGQNAYQLEIGSGDDNMIFAAHLFEMGGKEYLNLLTDNREISSIPAHQLFKVDQLEPAPVLRMADPGWFKDFLEVNPLALAHFRSHDPSRSDEEDAFEVVLTADTSVLQKFVRQHGSDEGFWTDPIRLKASNLE